METRQLGRTLVTVGIIGVVVAVIWWLSFYSQISSGIGGGGGAPLQCLFSSSGPCGLVSGVAEMAGYVSYSPAVLWISLIVLVIGVIIVSTSAPKVGAVPVYKMPAYALSGPSTSPKEPIELSAEALEALNRLSKDQKIRGFRVQGDEIVISTSRGREISLYSNDEILSYERRQQSQS